MNGCTSSAGVLVQEGPAALNRTSPNYAFADIIRLASMAAIVAMHCVEKFRAYTDIAPLGPTLVCLVQPFKFGTIGFFLVSGFLMSDGLERWRPGEYMNRRAKRLFAPWLFWYLAYAVVQCACDWPSAHGRSNSLASLFAFLGGEFSATMFRSSYWFIPNLLIAIGILLLFRGHLERLWFGGVLLLCSLIYGANLYLKWLPNESHTTAIAGFVFYLWLGAWTRRNLARVGDWTRRIPLLVLIAATAMTWMLAVMESLWLVHADPNQALNTLRLSNQLFSVAAVLLLFKVSLHRLPQLDLRSHTFGVYLIHWVVLNALMSMAVPSQMSRAINHLGRYEPVAAALVLTTSFVLTWGISMLMTEALLGTPVLRWMVGATRRIVPEPRLAS